MYLFFKVRPPTFSGLKRRGPPSSPGPEADTEARPGSEEPSATGPQTSSGVKRDILEYVSMRSMMLFSVTVLRKFI